MLALDLVLPGLARRSRRRAAACWRGAAIAGLIGKNKVAAATPAAPERAIDGLKEDVATVKGQRP